MSPRDRIVTPPSGRLAREPFASCLASGRMPVTGALMLAVLLTSARSGLTDPAAPPDPGAPGATLTLSVTETANSVRLRIQGSGDIEPGSLDVRFAGQKAVVVARDSRGRTIRSQRVQLPAAVVEDDATAEYDAEDALVLTLRKQPDAQAGALGDERDLLVP